MKGKVSNMKKWWMIAVVFALAMSLTSCSRRNNMSGNANFGWNFLCGTNQEGENNVGNYDIYVEKAQGRAGLNDVHIAVASLDTPGDTVEVWIVRSGNINDNKQILGSVTLMTGAEIYVGTVSDAELEQYDLLVLKTPTPGVPFLMSNPEKYAQCTLPRVGEYYE